MFLNFNYACLLHESFLDIPQTRQFHLRMLEMHVLTLLNQFVLLAVMAGLSQ